jgi:hypothetical protein
MTKKYKPEEILELIRQEADELESAAKECEADEIEPLITEIETWLQDFQDNLPLPLSEQAQPLKAKVEAALQKLKRKRPKVKAWKGAEIDQPEPIPEPIPEPGQPPQSPPSPPEPQKITKV